MTHPTHSAETLLAAIEGKYFMEPNSGCWLWEGAVGPRGYGYVSLPKTPGSHRAHRVSYRAYKGPIPEGLFICHKCDTPGCINPDHLFAGTPKENAQDAVRKGRLTMATHCKKGHPYPKDVKITGRGWRHVQ